MGLFDKKDQGCYTFVEHTTYVEDRYGNVYEETTRYAIPSDNCSQQSNSSETSKMGAKIAGSFLVPALLSLL
jgi:hypothetical protein